MVLLTFRPAFRARVSSHLRMLLSAEPSSHQKCYPTPIRFSCHSRVEVIWGPASKRSSRWTQPPVRQLLIGSQFLLDATVQRLTPSRKQAISRRSWLRTTGFERLPRHRDCSSQEPPAGEVSHLPISFYEGLMRCDRRHPTPSVLVKSYGVRYGNHESTRHLDDLSAANTRGASEAVATLQRDVGEPHPRPRRRAREDAQGVGPRTPTCAPTLRVYPRY